MSFLLDTCVISESTKAIPSDKVRCWLEAQSEGDLFISAITLAELWQGLAFLGKSKRRQRLEDFFEETVSTFEGRIIPVEKDIAIAWGNLRSEMQVKGFPVPLVDAFLAATALRHDLTFVTRNVADFTRTGVQLFNPWE